MPQREISQGQAFKTLMDVSKNQSMSRRGFGGLFLAGVTSAALVACGGGSDPTGVMESSSSSDQPKNLRAKYDALTSGMTKADVKALVGMEPNSSETEGELSWVNSTENLRVDFSAGGSELISGARYWSGSVDIYRGLAS